MCTHIDVNAFNKNLPFSRNAYIEQGMDVYLVSSLFDSMIQRPEPIRLTAIGTTEEGRLQQVAGSGYYAGDAQVNNVVETPVTLAAAAIALLTATIGGATTLTAAANIGTDLAIGDLIFLAVTGTVNLPTGSEIMKVRDILTATTFSVERGVLGSPIVAIAGGEIVYKIADVSGAFPGTPSLPATGPQVSQRNADGVHTAHNQVYGNIQTGGVQMSRGGRGSGAFVAGDANAKG